MTPKNDIQILRINYLHGSNIWTYREVLEVWLDLGELEQFPSHTLPGLNQRLEAWLPNLVEHTCTPGVRGGFLQRLAGGTWMGHVLEHVILELLNMAGMRVTFGQTRETTRSGTYKMVFDAPDESVARLALAEGHALLMAAINDRPADVAGAVSRLRARIDKSYLGPSTQCIVEAAGARRIPRIRLSGGNLVQLGYGVRQRRIWTAESDRTSAIGESIASDKDLTKTLLAACGVPVPEGRLAETPAAAWEAAQDIGLPVVVKPTDGNHARGVTLDLRAQADVEAAFALAAAEGSGVIVERFVPGTEHRILVVGGKVAAATRGEPVEVVGDGASTVAQLVEEQMNSDPRRGWEHQYPLTTIDVERDAGVRLELRRQGLDAASVPAAGQRVLIQRTGNMAIDCTDDVHPEVAHAVTLAARIVGLDIAGIDLVARDIRRPLQAQGGAIVEVNAGPSLLMHLTPTAGRPRPVGEAIRDHLFAEGETGRIPVVGIAGSRHSAAVARLVAWLAHLDGKVTGLACRDGLFVGRRRFDASDSAHWQAGERILVNRNVEAAVIENGPASILQSGLAYDRCQVGVVTDADIGPGLAHFDIHDAEQMRKVMRTQVDVVLRGGAAVLHGAVPAVADLASLCDGEVVLYACDPETPAVAAHRAAGGRAVVMRDRRVVLAADGRETPLPGLGDPDDWRARHGDVPDEALLAAVAAGWALGIAPRLVGAGLAAFEPEPGVPLARSAALPEQADAAA